MGSHSTLIWYSFLLVTLIISLIAGATDVRSRRNEDLVAATEEMQRANYFTYVMLINMAAAAVADLFPGNVTFLMPNDRTLAKTALFSRENAAADFLLRHSIPSALLFDDMLHFPTNSMIPTSNPDNSMLRVANDGRRRFFLNNVRVISPNICTGGSSVRCHGIDGVVLVDHQALPSCSSPTNDSISPPPPPPPGPASAVATAPAPLPEPAPVDRGGINVSDPSTAAAPQKSSAGRNGSHDLLSHGRLSIEFAIMTLMMLLLACMQIEHFHEMRLW